MPTALDSVDWPDEVGFELLPDDVTTVEQLLDPKTVHTLENACVSDGGYASFLALADLSISHDAIPNGELATLPVLQLLACRGGAWLTYEHMHEPYPRDQYDDGDISGCRDRLKLLGIEYPDHERGVVGYLDTNGTTPNAVYRAEFISGRGGYPDP